MEQEQDKKNSFAALEKISIIQLLWEQPNYIWLLLSALTTYAEIERFLKIASEKLSELNPNCVISVTIWRS